MFLVEILALCGIAHLIMDSCLFESLYKRMSLKWFKDLASSPQCLGFWVGFIAYAVVALSAAVPWIEISLPMVALVATCGNIYIQWTLVFLLGGLMSFCVLLSRRVIELIYNANILIAVRSNLSGLKRCFGASWPAITA